MKKYKGVILRLALALLLFALCFALTAFARRHAEWVDTYFNPYSRAVSGFLGRVFSAAPFVSVGEFLLYGLIAALLLLLVVSLIKGRFFVFLSYLALIAGCLAFFFIAVWGLNYYSPPLSDSLGIPITQYSESQLLEATRYYIKKANEYSLPVNRDEGGVFDAGGFKGLAGGAVACFENLQKKYPRFSAPYSAPKAVAAHPILSYSGITGIYNPFTGEANVNPDTPDISLGFSLCHEMAHRAGVAPENEANFVAFLACAGSDDPAFVYSGYYAAFVYCFNRLSDAGKQLLYPEINDMVYTDIEAVRVHYDRFEGPAQEVADKINDTYLKTLDQQEGTKSYGQVVDLLIAHYYMITAGQDGGRGA